MQNRWYHRYNTALAKIEVNYKGELVTITFRIPDSVLAFERAGNATLQRVKQDSIDSVRA